MSTSEGESTREPPTVLVTGGEQSSGETSRDCEDNFTEADSMAVDIGDDNEVEEEEEDEDEDVEEGEHDDGKAIVFYYNLNPSLASETSRLCLQPEMHIFCNLSYLRK